MSSKRKKARERVRVITEVWEGKLSPGAGAKALGISRKTYYGWEHRALSAVKTALSDRPPGRPENPTDPEKEILEARVKELEKELALAKGKLAIWKTLYGSPKDKLLKKNDGRDHRERGKKDERDEKKATDSLSHPVPGEPNRVSELHAVAHEISEKRAGEDETRPEENGAV